MTTGQTMQRTSLDTIRIHAIGDSLTVGIADVWTNNRLRAWPLILTQILGASGACVQLTSRHARSGATTTEIYGTQLGRVDLGTGDLACLWIGANDILRPSCSDERSEAHVHAIFDTVARAGAIPLTMELPLPSAILPGPGRLMRSWDTRCQRLNDVVRQHCIALGGVHLPWVAERGLTGPDGTHLSQWGHWRYALRYADILCARRELPPPTIPAPTGIRHTSGLERWRWYLQHGMVWLVRRQFDPPRNTAGQLARP